MRHITLAFSMVLLSCSLLVGCGGNSNAKTNEPVAQAVAEAPETPEVTEETFYLERPADSPVAYEVLQLMLKNGQDGNDSEMATFLEGRRDYHGLTELKFDLERPTENVTFYAFSDDYEDDWAVKCYPLKQGGWAVIASVFYIVGDWGPEQYFAYRYQDGKLTPANELLPNPKFIDIYNDPKMLEGLSEERITWLKDVMDGTGNEHGGAVNEGYDYVLGMYDAPFVVIMGSQSMAMSDAYYDNSEFKFAKTVYFWNGEQFEKAGPVEYFAYSDETESDEVVWEWDGEKMAPRYTVTDDSYQGTDTCDMRALREALNDPMLGQGNPTYGINHFEYYREMYNDSCQGWCDAFYEYLHCYPLKSGGFKVYETSELQLGWKDDNVDNGFAQFTVYIYKDGVLTETEAEPELNAFPVGKDGYHFSTVTGVDFNDRTVVIFTSPLDENNRRSGVEFTWDGTTMRKTREGMFDY